MRAGVIALVALSTFCSPLFADVLPSRRSVETPPQRELAARVEALGVPSVECGAQLSALTEDEMAFFAARPDRVQIVGAPQDMFSGEATSMWYEGWLGAGFLLGGILTIAYMLTNNE